MQWIKVKILLRAFWICPKRLIVLTENLILRGKGRKFRDMTGQEIYIKQRTYSSARPTGSLFPCWATIISTSRAQI